MRFRLFPLGGASLAAALVAFVAAAPLFAQVRPAPDTVRVPIPPEALPPDTFTARAPADTVVADSLLPAAALPLAPAPRGQGWAVGVWAWDREELLRFHGLSLLELLERVPALVITRGGSFGTPAGVAAWGLGGGRLRVFRDGWELDPLGTTDFDLQRLALVDLEGVRVERRLGETRIHLQSYRLGSRESRSRFEGGTGDLNTRLLRALFAAPVGASNTLLVAGDIVDTDGARGQGFTSGTAIGRWTREIATGTALELEYRQNGFDRSGTFRSAATRRDLVLRARSQLSRALQLDAQLGRSSEDPRGADSLSLTRSAIQGAARALLDVSALWAEVGVRGRSDQGGATPRPGFELFTAAQLRAAPWLLAHGSARSAAVAGVSGTEAEVGVRLGGERGPAVFAEGTVGRRAIGLPRDTAGGGPPSALASPLTGLRAGAEWRAGPTALGAALVSLDVARLSPFGLRFEPNLLPLEGGRSTGIEAHGVLATSGVPLSLAGNYVHWTDRGGRPYLPPGQGYAALMYHDRFYGGQLEPDARLEVTYRDAASVPLADGTTGATLRYAMTDFRLQIRIIDVRLFLVFQNLLNFQPAADVPGLLLPGARVMYGARWDFRN